MASGSQNNTTYQAQKWTNLRAFTIGNTAKNVDGTAAVSWSKDEILGASTDAYFLRGDKVWSNTLNGVLLLPNGLKTGSRVSNSGSGIVIDNDGGIEIFHTSTPFIDFHYQASTADYSVRLMCDSATNIHDSGSFTAGKYITAKGDITADGGYLYSTLNGNTVQIGSQNGSYAHFTNTKNIPFWFNKAIESDGGFTIYNTNNHWRNGYLDINNTSGGDCYISLLRATNGDCRIVNSGATLYLQSNYNGGKGNWHNLAAFSHSYGGIWLYDDDVYIEYGDSPALYLRRGNNTNWRLMNNSANLRIQCSYYNNANQNSGNNYSDFITCNYNSGDTWIRGSLTVSGASILLPGTAEIKWTSGTWWQRIAITDDSNAGTAVFNFQQSEGTSDSSWKTLCQIYDNQRVYAAGGFFAGNGYINSNTGYVYNSSTNWAQFQAQNGNGSCSILCATNRGVYDNTDSKWIIFHRISDNAVLSEYNLYAYHADNAPWSGISSKPATATRWPTWSEIGNGADGLSEGTSSWTDNTEILTSYASNNGFADTNAKGRVYRRDAVCAYNYIKGKAEGTWSIDVTGSAGSVAWGNVSSKPATATRWPSWSEVTSKPAVQNNLTSTSTTDMLSAAQGKALNENKTAKGTGLAYTTLLNQTYAGTSYKTITVSNISSYNALHFACYFPSWWRGSMLIPISEFKSHGVTIFFMINGSTPEYANFKYISDTSIQISTDYGHSLVFRIWGAKTS